MPKPNQICRYVPAPCKNGDRKADNKIKFGYDAEKANFIAVDMMCKWLDQVETGEITMSNDTQYLWYEKEYTWKTDEKINTADNSSEWAECRFIDDEIKTFLFYCKGKLDFTQVFRKGKPYIGFMNGDGPYKRIYWKFEDKKVITVRPNVFTPYYEFEKGTDIFRVRMICQFLKQKRKGMAILPDVAYIWKGPKDAEYGEWEISKEYDSYNCPDSCLYVMFENEDNEKITRIEYGYKRDPLFIQDFENGEPTVGSILDPEDKRIRSWEFKGKKIVNSDLVDYYCDYEWE